MSTRKYDLKPGDRIIEPLFQTGLTKHHVVFLGIDQNGVEWMAENQKFKGVRIITAQAYFAETRKIDRIERFGGTNAERKQVVQRALRLAGKPYDLINYNCEHFANEVLTGRVESKQVEKAFIAVLGLLLFGLFVNE